MQSEFIHLHLHTKYSFLDGMCKFDNIIESARKFNMPAVAITDHGNMFGVVEFYSALSKAGIKPIIGMEAYIVNDIKHVIEAKIREKNHIVLLVKDYRGYKNLIKIASYAATEGYYYKPTVDKNFLREHSEGLIAISACVKGEVPSKIITADTDGARAAAEEYLSVFGEGNFYLELQNHGLKDELAMNRGLKELSKELSIPVVATNDVHYISKEDAKAHDVLLCIQTGKTIDDTNRMSFETEEFYFKNFDEMAAVFPNDRDAVERTAEVANKCDFKLELNKKLFMPSYELQGGGSYEEHLEKISGEALKTKYGEITPALSERFEHEMRIIKKLGYSGYFLIVRDIVNFARDNDIPVGPGRGSAAGSVVSYALGITNVDPMKYGLLFERFLNPDRVSPPDIDIDFSDEERDRVIEFIVNKFGKEKVAQIITFQTLKARQAIRDVGRALDVPLKEVDALSKKVPDILNIKFEDILKDENFIAFVNIDESGTREELVNYAVKLEGLMRQASLHAAGVVIAPEELTNFVPVAFPKEKDRDRASAVLNYMTQYPMESLEKIGLLKFDILGLRNLSVIKNTVKMVKENKGEDVVLDEKFDDPNVYRLLSEGNTTGVFQLESDGMRDILQKIKPSTFEEIIAIISLFRPGPMKMIDDYIKRKKGAQEIKYDFKELEPVLKETYGIAIYQEQVMQIAVEIAGFTMAEADKLRRAMSKKKEKEMAEIRVKFIKGAKKKGINEEGAEELFEKLDQFSQYGFNKSHAAAYAVLAYQTGFLKSYHPAEYMASVLTSYMHNIDKTAFYVADCRANRLEILPPDINKSSARFSVDRNRIRYGLAAIKNVGVTAAEGIVEERLKAGEFKSLFDFCERIDLRSVNSRTLESLIKSGAFDFTLSPRAALFAGIDKAMKNAEAVQKDRAIGQSALFGADEQPDELPDITEWSESRLLSSEKEVLGFYVSSHPLARYEKLLDSVAVKISDLLSKKNHNNEQVIAGGIIHGLNKKISAGGGEKMNFFLEDLTGKIMVYAGEKVTKEKKSLFEESKMFMIRGRMGNFDDRNVLFMESVIEIDDAYEKLGKFVHVTLREIGLDDITIKEIKNIISRHKGSASVILHVLTKDNKEIELELAENEKVKVSESLIHELETAAGIGNVRLSWKK